MKHMTKEQQDKALVDNLGLVHVFVRRIMSKRMIPDHHKEDIVQAGTIGLMRALAKFDIDKGTKVSTYAWWWIRIYANRAIQDLDLIRVGRDHRSARLAFLGCDPRRGVDPYDDDVLEGRSDDVEEAVMLRSLRSSMEQLPPNLQDLLVRRMEGATLEQIGRDWRLSRERIRQLEAVAHRELRDLVAGRQSERILSSLEA